MNQNLEEKKAEKDIMVMAETKIQELQSAGGIDIPSNYSLGNALKSAMLAIRETKNTAGQYALSVCTHDSIANALLYMAVQALSPAKKQCYFVMYGNQLQCLRSYHGTKASVKRLKNVRDVVANVIYEGDIFDTEIIDGIKKVVRHEQPFKNIVAEKMIGAYCVILMHDGNHYSDWMTMNQINKSWKKSKTFGGEKPTTHIEYPDQMAMRTVINRTCKSFVNTSDDSDIFVGAFNQTDSQIVDADVVETKPKPTFVMPVQKENDAK